MIKLNFNVDNCFLEGIKRLSSVIGYEIGEGIRVSAVCGERIGVCLKDKNAVIYYREKHHFFRELSLLSEHAAKESEFDITENGHFKMLGAMIDASRCAVPKVKTVKSLIDYFALMGYSMAMLYMEDVVELEGRPYFGYMRGRYTPAELREIDDYACEYGIEVIPSLECYGHMGNYLRWREAAEIKDTEKVFLAREEKTFEFLDKLISTVSSCFRTKRIHIGMDEAWDMGRGKFLDKNGYVAPIDIFNEYMARLVPIAKKYGLTPMMWSDMYFRVETDNNAYYGEQIVISEKTKSQIPEGVDLVFWHYGEEPRCDEYMIEKHLELERKVIFAGGVWCWSGHMPEHNHMMDSTKFSFDACRKFGVVEAMTTIWLNDNAECPYMLNLFGLSYTAEIAYDENPSKEKLRARFEASTGASYDAFFAMSAYHNIFDGNYEYPTFMHRFLGKSLFWQDILAGLYETHLYEKPMSAHYKKYAEFLAPYSKSEKWANLYEFAYLVFDYLAEKCYIAERLAPAYKNGDKKTLKNLISHIKMLSKKTEAIHRAHKAIWLDSNKAFGWSRLDIRYAGVRARCATACEIIGDYLAGKIDEIEELEAQRLPLATSAFIHYLNIAHPDNAD